MDLGLMASREYPSSSGRWGVADVIAMQGMAREVGGGAGYVASFNLSIYPEDKIHMICFILKADSHSTL